jgi:glycosyltransferase involved in cell wall biosynthesis
MKYSILIPTYDMAKVGHLFLAHSFDKLCAQEFKDFEVVVSDNSENDMNKLVCDKYADFLDIKYVRNLEKKGCSANLNFGMKQCTGEYIKFLFQDDFLLNEYSMKIIDNHIREQDDWIVTACEHSMDGITMMRPFYPMYNDSIHLGNNTISSPSVLTIRNKDVIEFDENSRWLLDVDYYKRLYAKYGEPRIVNAITVVNRIGAHQVTSSLITDNIIKYEYEYMKNKHK